MGYPAQPKLSDQELTWPCKPDFDENLESAYYLPGPESQRQAINFINVYKRK